jgi:hypothetical protein
VLPILLLLATVDDDLANSVQATTSAERYSFEIESQNSKIDGRYQRGSPLFARADGVEFFREGKRLVYQQDGKWHRTRTDTLSDPLRILGPTAKVQIVRIPHEELAQLSKALRNVKNSTEQGIMMVSGEFGEADARELARSEDRDVARGGVARLWIANGKVTKYQIAITLQGRRGNADVNGVAETTVTLRHYVGTSYAVPEEATKALKD